MSQARSISVAGIIESEQVESTSNAGGETLRGAKQGRYRGARGSEAGTGRIISVEERIRGEVCESDKRKNDL